MAEMFVLDPIQHYMLDNALKDYQESNNKVPIENLFYDIAKQLKLTQQKLQEEREAYQYLQADYSNLEDRCLEDRYTDDY